MRCDAAGVVKQADGGAMMMNCTVWDAKARQAFTERSQFGIHVMLQRSAMTPSIRLHFSSSKPMRDSCDVSMKRAAAGDKARFLGNEANEEFSCNFNEIENRPTQGPGLRT